AHDFKGEGDENRATGRDGLVTTQHVYKHVALVRVIGQITRVRLPVEILDERTVTCKVPVNTEAENRGQLELRRKLWTDQLHESRLVVNELIKELNKLVQDKPKALEKAKTGLKVLQADIQNASEEMASLRSAAQELGGEKLDLTEGEKRLQELRHQQEK